MSKSAHARRAIAVLCIMVVVGLGASVASAVDRRPAVCRVSVPLGGSSAAGGSGTLVYLDTRQDRALILTAAHVVRGATGRPVCIFETRSGTVRAISFDHHVGPQDVAAIECRAKYLDGIAPLRVWPGELQPRMPVWGEGYAGNVGFGRRRGVIQRAASTMQASFPSIPGDSGGLIMTVDRQRRPYLIGVVSASDWQQGYSGPQPGTFTVGPSAPLIRSWLREVGYTVGSDGRVSCFPGRQSLGGRQWSRPDPPQYDAPDEYSAPDT